MTTEEWRSKSDEWRKGWKCCQNAQDIPEEKSTDFVDGYIYALEHPFGVIAIPQQKGNLKLSQKILLLKGPPEEET